MCFRESTDNHEIQQDLKTTEVGQAELQSGSVFFLALLCSHSYPESLWSGHDPLLWYWVENGPRSSMEVVGGVWCDVCCNRGSFFIFTCNRGPYRVLQRFRHQGSRVSSA